MDGSRSIRPQSSLKQCNRLRPLPARGQHLRLHFQSCSQGQGQVRLSVQRTLLQLFQC